MAEQDGAGMFLNCSHCGLSIAMRFPSMQMEHCPRCLARARLLQPLLRSPLPSEGPADTGSDRQPRAEPRITAQIRRSLSGSAWRTMLVSHLECRLRYRGATLGNQAETGRCRRVTPDEETNR